MKRYKLLLRSAEEEDCKDLWRWRNCPQVRNYFFDSSRVPWQTHKRWFSSIVNHKKAKIYIAEGEGAKIGVIRFESKRNAVTVSVNLNPDFFGKGLGARLIKLGSERFYSDTEERRPIVAEIRGDNIVSRKAFSKAGYEYAGGNNKAVIYKMGRSS
ncbi:MAG: GNAT family protein [Candidatus Omnitrophica bacterium]|nr:GNAT family protein [Candidatus Omnitrophota bacterium]